MAEDTSEKTYTMAEIEAAWERANSAYSALSAVQQAWGRCRAQLTARYIVVGAISKNVTLVMDRMENRSKCHCNHRSDAIEIAEALNAPSP